MIIILYPPEEKKESDSTFFPPLKLNKRECSRFIEKAFTELGVTYDELAKAMQKAANIDLSALEAKRAKAGARDIQGKPTTNFELEQLNAYYRELERVSALEAKRARNEETLRRRGYADRLTAYGRMPEGDLTSAEEKLRKLLALKNDLRRDPLLSLSQMQQLDNRIQTD